MKVGEHVRVREEGGTADWVEGEVIFASENGKSVVVALESPLGIGGFAMIPGIGIAVCLLQEGDGFVDVHTDKRCEVQPAVLADAKDDKADAADDEDTGI